jgi:hypothetical protein
VDPTANEERLDPAFERPFPAIPLRPLFWIDAHGQNDKVLLFRTTVNGPTCRYLLCLVGRSRSAGVGLWLGVIL